MADTVATPSAAYLRAEEKRRLIRALMGGTEAMRALTTEGLLKFDSEDTADYNVRLNDSFLWPAFSEAIYNIVGRMFAEPLVLSDDTPDAVIALWDDIDLHTTQADVFLYRVMLDAVPYGDSWVLVDGPPAMTGRLPGGLRTLADEQKDGARPFWTHYLTADVIEPPLWVFENGRPRIHRMRVRANVEVEKGQWGSEILERVIVYRRGETMAANGDQLQDPGRNVFPLDPANSYFASFETHEKSIGPKGEETWSIIPKLSGHYLPPRSASDDLRKRFVNLPLVRFPVSVDGLPPLSALAELVLQHWRKKSRLDTILDNINTPVMVGQMTRADFEGSNMIHDVSATQTTNTRQLRIGSQTILFTGGENRTIGWMEHSGASIAAGREDLQALEQQIRQAANDPFERRPTGNETATSQLLAEQGSRTQAQVWAALAESSADECLEWTSAWLGEDEVGSVMFGGSAMKSLDSTADFGQVLELWEKGRLNDAQLISEAKRYGIIDVDTVPAAPLKAVGEQRGSFDILTVKQEPLQVKPAPAGEGAA